MTRLDELSGSLRLPCLHRPEAVDKRCSKYEAARERVFVLCNAHDWTVATATLYTNSILSTTLEKGGRIVFDFDYAAYGGPPL